MGNPEIDRIAQAIEAVNCGINYQKFKRKAKRGIPELALKSRVFFLIECLNELMPDNNLAALRVLEDICDAWRVMQSQRPVHVFGAWPLIDYIGVYGVSHPKESLTLLKKVTSLFSAEFAIRPYVELHPDKVFTVLRDWVKDSDHHVRRLSSEGIRPRLPWGQQLSALIDDPKPIFPVLSALMEDDSEYVRKSVANNLNDISKDHPDLALRFSKNELKVPQRAKDLKEKEKNSHSGREHNSASQRRYWIINKGLRTLVKNGHSKVFPLLGYTTSVKVNLTGRILTERLNLGESLAFEIECVSESKMHQQLVVDYSIEFVKSNGKTSEKVFKFKTLSLAPRERVALRKVHAIKPLTTRRYYSGDHKVNILVNGQRRIPLNFHLNASNIPQKKR